MHAGSSFSYSSISVLLKQPLSIKKSYAGAIQRKTKYVGPIEQMYLNEKITIGPPIGS
jgi:hypothetical protein